MEIKIKELYDSAYERCNETLGPNWCRLLCKDDAEVYTVSLNENVILKTVGDSIKLDLGGKVEYLSQDDFVEVTII